MKKIDIHSHILAGIDDGASDLETSVEMLKAAAKDGIRELIATPHFHYHRGHAGPETIHKCLAELKSAAKAEKIPVRLYAGNELYYTQELLEIVKAGEALTMAGSDYVLIEFSENEEKRRIQNAVYEFLSEGYYPILAHIERYRAFVQEPEFAGEIHRMGAYCQINGGSASGLWKIGSRRFEKSMIRSGMIQFLATDAHDTEKRPAKFGKTEAWIRKRCGEDECRSLLYGNAKKILNNQII